MEQIKNNDQEKYISKFYEPVLTVNEFISLLLPYLYKRGVRTLTEDELAKKLLPYYLDKKYQLLFTDLVKDRYSEKVDIAEGMYTEKYFSRCIIWYSNNPDKLHLAYGDDFDTSFYEKDVNPEVLKLLNSIADDLAVRSKIENPMLNVYGYDPNKSYSILHAKHLGIYESELITDGNIKSINKHKFEPHIYYQDPSGRSLGRQYEKAVIRSIILDNASYAIVQGKFNDELRKIEIYSKIVELEKLKRISEFANKTHDDITSLLTREKPYVRKLLLD